VTSLWRESVTGAQMGVWCQRRPKRRFSAEGRLADPVAAQAQRSLGAMSASTCST